MKAETRRWLDYAEDGLAVRLTDEECDLLDAIYLPSKYPLGGVLPDVEPDAELCERCVQNSERLHEFAFGCLADSDPDVCN